MKVIKRNVEQFEIGDGTHVNLTLDRTAAVDLYHVLGDMLGFPRTTLQGCGDRYSHGPHWHGARSSLWCGGRSFDAT